MKKLAWTALLLCLVFTLSVSATETDEQILLQTTLTQATLETATSDQTLVMSTEEAMLRLSTETAQTLLQSAEEVTFTLTQGNLDNLTAEQQEQVGENQLYHLSVTLDGQPLLGWGDLISVTLPYTPTREGQVVAWQLSASLGHSYQLTTSYEADLEQVTFQTVESGYVGLGVNPFEDLAVEHFAYIPALWASEQGIVNGTGEGMFSPDETCTRGMIATVLWRMSGEQDWGICYPYADVEGDLWYTDAVYWCTVNSIVTGYEDETFRPDQAITREQLITMLYRYAQYLELDISAGENTNILSYTDVFEVSDYAISAVQWGCAVGMVEGDSTALYPQREATRGELVTMLWMLSQQVEG